MINYSTCGIISFRRFHQLCSWTISLKVSTIYSCKHLCYWSSSISYDLSRRYFYQYLILLPIILSSIFLIIANLFTYNAWIWFINKILFFHKKKWPIIIAIFICWILTTATMLLYNPIIESIDLLLWASFLESTTLISYITFPLYLFLVIYTTYIVSIKIQKRELTQAFFFIVAWLIISYLWYNNYIEHSYIYYWFIAFGEEFLKFNFWNILYKKFQVTMRDIVIFSIVSALGFAFIEHIVYLISNDSISSFSSANKLLLQRGILTTSVHVMFTWIIWYWILYNQLHNSKIYILIAILLWIWLHRFYNISMFQNFTLLLPIRAIASYLTISFFLFQSDILYKTTSATES